MPMDTMSTPAGSSGSTGSVATSGNSRTGPGSRHGLTQRWDVRSPLPSITNRSCVADWTQLWRRGRLWNGTRTTSPSATG